MPRSRTILALFFCLAAIVALWFLGYLLAGFVLHLKNVTRESGLAMGQQIAHQDESPRVAANIAKAPCCCAQNGNV